MGEGPITDLQRIVTEATDAIDQLARRGLEVVGGFVHDHRDEIDGFLDRIAGHRPPPAE